MQQRTAYHRPLKFYLFFNAPTTVISLILSRDALSDTAAEIANAIPSAANAVVVIIIAVIVYLQRLFYFVSIPCFVTFYTTKQRTAEQNYRKKIRNGHHGIQNIGYGENKSQT